MCVCAVSLSAQAGYFNRSLSGGNSEPIGVMVDGGGKVHVAGASENAAKPALARGVDFGSVSVNPDTPAQKP